MRVCMYVCVCVCVHACVCVIAWQIELVLFPVPLTVGLGQAWHRYFCQFKKNDQMGSSKKLRQMKLIPIGHHGLVSKLMSNGGREDGVSLLLDC